MIHLKKILNLISVCVFSVCFSYCSASDSNPMTPVQSTMQNDVQGCRCAPICPRDCSSQKCDISLPANRLRSLSSPEAPSLLHSQDDLTATLAYNVVNQASCHGQGSTTRRIKIPVLPALVHNGKDNIASNKAHRRTCSSDSAACACASDYKQDNTATCGLNNFHTRNIICDNNATPKSPAISRDSNIGTPVCRTSSAQHSRSRSSLSTPRSQSPSMVTLSLKNYKTLCTLATNSKCNSPFPGVLEDPHGKNSDMDMGSHKVDKLGSAAYSSSSPVALSSLFYDTTTYTTPHYDSSGIRKGIYGTEDDISPLNERDVYTLLCCDGGGMRGGMQMKQLEKLQRAVEARSGRNIKLAFNGYAGTSTGALTVTSVALGRNHDLYEHYSEYGRRIFTRNWWSCWGVFGPKYYSYGRMECIQEFVGDMFGRELGADLMVPYYSALTRTTKVYTNFHPDDDLRLADVLMMSSAAPTYFNPHYCESEHNVRYVGIDGGIFSNHPGLIAYHEVRQRYPDAHIIMLSLGTGECCNYGDSDRYWNRGLLSWASEFPSLAIESSSWNIHEQLINLSETVENFEYIRLQPRLDSEDLVTDNTDPRYIQKLISACDAYIARHPPEYQRAIDVCAQYCAKEI